MRCAKIILTSSFLLFMVNISAQIKVGNNLDSRNATSLIEMESDSLVFVPTRMNTADRDAIASPLTGAVIYNTQDSCLQVYDGTNWDCTSSNKKMNWFYAPSIVIEADSLVNNVILNLHDQYVNQFGNPMFKNDAAPSFIPTYAATELNYYITYYDTTVMNIDSLSDAGELQYDITAIPSDLYTQINIVFVIKDP